MTAQPAEPPWYGPVCPVVWAGRHREVSPYPDHFHRRWSARATKVTDDSGRFDDESR
jgi:hypothetical protein